MTSAERPRYDQLQSVANVQTAALVQRLQRQESLAGKRPLVWALAVKAEPAGAASLRELLTRNYAKRQLSQADEQTLLDSVRVLGFFARRDERTAVFLSERTDPAVWAKTVTWQSTRGDYIHDLLTSYAIQALGIGNRADAERTVEALRGRSAKYLHKFAGDIVQADFYRYVGAPRGGQAGLLEYLTTDDDEKNVFTQWRQNEGKQAFDWANTRMRGPAPED